MNRDQVLSVIQEAREAEETPNFRGATLTNADLSGVDLVSTDLCEADLMNAFAQELAEEYNDSTGDGEYPALF